MGSVRFQPGWDCHGMPIEHRVLKKFIKIDQKFQHQDFNWPSAVRKESSSLAAECIENQKAGFKRWGIRADWNNPYLTYDIDYVSKEMQIFWMLFQRGLIYRGERPVYFSPSSMSVLADSEIEYQNVTDTAVYVKFPLTRIPQNWLELASNRGKSGICVLIWTTQPWTLLANAAVAFNPQGSYCLISDGKRSNCLYLVDESVIDKIREIVDDDLEIVANVEVSELDNVQYEFINMEKGKYNLCFYTFQLTGRMCVETGLCLK